MDMRQLPVAHLNTAMTRPVRPGSSISVVAGLPGTACAVVRRSVGRASQLYLLSCEHVIFDARAQHNTIVQPASVDQPFSTPGQFVAAAASRGQLRASGLNEIDAAIARIDSGISMRNIPMGTTRQFNSTTSGFGVDDEVVVYGRTTGMSQGLIVNESLSVHLDYSKQGFAGALAFHNIVQATYPSEGGDSGAPVILARSGELIGMHIAGDDSFGYFCKIERVFSRLQLRLA